MVEKEFMEIKPENFLYIPDKGGFTWVDNTGRIAGVTNFVIGDVYRFNSTFFANEKRKEIRVEIEGLLFPTSIYLNESHRYGWKGDKFFMFNREAQLVGCGKVPQKSLIQVENYQEVFLRWNLDINFTQDRIVVFTIKGKYAYHNPRLSVKIRNGENIIAEAKDANFLELGGPYWEVYLRPFEKLVVKENWEVHAQPAEKLMVYFKWDF